MTSSEKALRYAEKQVAKFRVTLAQPAPAESAPDLSVAVIVPTFNDCRFLGPALRSVANQTYSDWRCYVIDDGSPQGVERVFNRFADDDRFVLLRHGANAGLAAARNTGARIARESLLQFLDADDLLTPWALEKRAEVFQEFWADPLLAAAYGPTLQCGEQTKLSSLRERKRSKTVDDVDWLSSDGDCPFTVHACLLRRSVFIDVGGFDEAFQNGAEDWEFWQRVLRHGYFFRGTPYVVGAYRQRGGSMYREHSQVHINRAAALLTRANEPAILRDESPMPYRMALGPLRADYRRTRRAALSAGICFAQTASIDESLRAVAPLTDGAVIIPSRGKEFTRLVKKGIVRGLGLAQSDVAMLQESTSALLERAAANVAFEMICRGASGALDTEPEIDMSHRTSCDIVLIAEHAGDVDALDQVAVEAELNGLSAVALDVEVVSAAQGANDRWRALGRQLVPYNALCLGALSARAVVGRRPGGPTTWSTLGSVAASNGVAFVVAPDNDAIVIAESPPSRKLHEIRAATPAQIVARTATAPFWSMLDQRIEPGKSASSGNLSNSATGPEITLGSDFVALLPREESRLHDKSMRTLRRLRNAHAGETAVVIGNGPSLNDTDLSLLADVATFGVNSIFLAGDRLPGRLTYYVVEDSAVMKENTDAIKAYEAELKLFPSNYLEYFETEEVCDNTVFFRMNAGFYNRGTGTYCLPRFSTDASQRLFCGQSVTIINLQLAYWMGFERVVLIGMDFSYQIPEDSEINRGLIVSQGDDPNHFHPDYFGAGKTWKHPQLDRVLANYRLAKQVYEADGRRIINATVGGALEVFERSTLAELLV